QDAVINHAGVTELLVAEETMMSIWQYCTRAAKRVVTYGLLTMPRSSISCGTNHHPSPMRFNSAFIQGKFQMTRSAWEVLTTSKFLSGLQARAESRQPREIILRDGRQVGREPPCRISYGHIGPVEVAMASESSIFGFGPRTLNQLFRLATKHLEPQFPMPVE